jgi:hypothetical protein
MNARYAIPLLALAALTAGGAASVTASATTSPASQAKLVIRHQLQGCHSWSLNGVSYRSSQAATIRRGGSITVTNNDVMPHKLVETSGPAVAITRVTTGMGRGMGLKGTFPPAMLARMGSASRLTFAKPGVYKFTTKAGEDYMSGVKTVGEDNVLTLTVTVR